MNLVAGTASYTLPSSVARIKQIIAQLAGTTGNTAPVKQVGLEKILSMRRNVGVSPVTGTITHYALFGLSDLEVFPTPTSADTLTIYCVALPTALSANSDVPILTEPYASKLLEYGALVEAADYVKDPFGYLAYDMKYQEWMQRFRADLNRKRGGQTEQFELVPLRDWPPNDPSVDLRN